MKQDGDRYAADYLRQGSPTNTTFAESIPRLLAGGDLALASSGVELAVGVPLQAGDVISTITFITGGTAANGPTAGYAVLRGTDGTKLVQTADFGSTARAANTAYSVSLTSSYTIVTPGLYYVGLSLTVSTTMPTVRGVSVGNATVAGAVGLSAKILAQSHGSSVGATAPSTIATPTTVATVPYIVLT